MAFIEGSGGTYRLIRVLFDTIIYERALELCWHESSYKIQIAVVTQLLKLQQKQQLPSHVTAEDITSLVFEKSSSSLREHLWEFELEDFEKVEAKPLLSLVWSVNNSNKRRDVEFLAKMLLNSPESAPPSFQNPKVIRVAKEYAEILKERQPPAPKLLNPHEVALEVVPRVLQGLWVLPPRPVLNMVSQRLSKMTVGVTKAVIDGVSKVITAVDNPATFSRSTRDEMVESILAAIRQTCPHDVLINCIKGFSAVLLNGIVEIAVKHICGIFKPQSVEEQVHLPSTTELEPELEELAEEDSDASSAPPDECDSSLVQEEIPEEQPVFDQEASYPVVSSLEDQCADPYALPIRKKRCSPPQFHSPLPVPPPDCLQQACSSFIRENKDVNGKILVPGIKSTRELTVLWYMMLNLRYQTQYTSMYF